MPSEPRRAPTTYRLQLRGGIGFDEARVLVTYLERLGITDLYLSPSFTARRGSAHGYDVVDPTRLDPALGGRQAFERLARELRSRGMGLVLDVVPNHLAADPANPWWADVLRRGRRSRFARFFDIEWDAPGVGGRIVLPILPAAVDEVLGAGGFSIGARGDGSTLRVAGTWLPLAEGSEAAISEHGARWWNRDREAPSRVRAYRSLLEAQAYLPVWWREGNARVNHRRFFDISDLAAVRQEDPTVFRASHAAVLGLVRRGLVTGLRIDHVDGLADPSGYLDRLRRRAPSALLLVEKILAPDERIPPGWPVDGTTGYGVMNDMNDLFVDAMGWRDLGRVVERFGGRAAVAFDEIRLVSRRRALEELFPAEVGSLVRRLAVLARRLGTPIEDGELWDVVVEVTARLPVYRTYARGGTLDATTRRRISQAVRTAWDHLPEGCRPALAFARRVLLLDLPEDAPTGARSAWAAVLRRWQLLMGPAAAKGVEDTALYRDVRLVSRNEVGGDPGVAPIGVEEFHRRVRSMREGPWPLVATTTHDTKRSEDVRARIAVLSELPEEWERRVRRWSRANGELRRSIHGGAVPSPDEELFLYQTLVGAWPLGEAGDLEERIRAYVVKAAREARLRTSWLDPDASYEALLEGFVHDALTSDRFRHDLEGFVRIVAYHGALNSLAQVVLKAFLPGATDVYQGTETWRLDLVDPDNRRPVDFGALTRMLEELDGSVVDPERLLAEWPDGRIKLFVTASALRLRRERPVPFVAGSYLPLAARGPKADHVIALVRRSRRQWVMAVVPRLTLRLAGSLEAPLGPIWGRTALALPAGAPARWRDVLTGAIVTAHGSEGGAVLALRTVLERLPVAMLVREDAAP